MSRARIGDSAARIAQLAWPVFIGQVAVLAFNTVDTVMLGRHDPLDLAALAIGASTYTTIFIGLMGVVLAVGPIAGQLYGAKRLPECGAQLHQAMWLALLMAVPGCLLLAWPEPFLAIAQAPPEVANKVRGYLGNLAFALPFALLFASFRGFNTAVSRPKAVMALQLVGLAIKVPLNTLFIFGFTLPTPLGAWNVEPMGAPGCALATAIVNASQVFAAWLLVRRDPFYAPFGLTARLARPDRASLAALLRLGVPMGASIMVEVTGFTSMALFISRIGTTPVAGHAIALNLVSMMFMMPMAIANASSTLVAQNVGAERHADARRLGWHGLELGLLVAAAMGGAVYLLREPILGVYTRDAAVIAAALPLLAWVALFHVADAAQTIAAFVLRAYRIATVPMLIYVAAIWGVGLGGGYVLAFDVGGLSPPSLQGAQGFWSAATAGLVVAGAGMTAFLAWFLRRQRRSDAARV